ncbi:hypothetical protein ASF88_01845 [Leifsonia sp. Leaf336]|uniref:glycoside hydrolase family 43 protein n=1 Tax=Leifsonia sp. Leaf336 TaxID=1736341 RepID=UPI0006FF7012|nr:glycoside hydrolase family 43 protein [Leifsonia sp. Leaf336]KQR53629.1 hypothetical protein ASF88_01845 [Leifsonia sp. Leaf336]
MGAFAAYLMAYFCNGDSEDAEQIRFALSAGRSPTRWIPLRGGAPMLRSTVGQLGARDPFLLRDERRGRFIVIATDLRIHPDGNWHRAVRQGSRSITIWESSDLLAWTPPRTEEIASASAGNVWAPKAFLLPDGETWRVFFASALYESPTDREAEAHQRILTVDTTDFRAFTSPAVYWDPGHDVIDATFLEWEGELSRFAADSLTADRARRSQFVRQDRAASLDTSTGRTVSLMLGSADQARAEGPAAFAGLDDGFAYLLLDEFELRGYQLYRSRDPHSGDWEHVTETMLPAGARHGSVIPITADEEARLTSWRS